MNDKLQQLTDKLYEEGLAKGREEGERLVGEAQEEAVKILAEARAEAAEIVAAAKAEAAEQSKNAMTELSIAERQVVSQLKASIAELVVAQVIKEPLHKALTPQFVADFLIALASVWNGGKASLEAMLPESKRTELNDVFRASAAKLLSAGIEVRYSSSVKSGFRVAEKGGHYYVSFAEEDFEALLGEYLKGKATEMLFE